MVLRNATAWMAAACLISVMGCAASRSNTAAGPSGARTAQSIPPANRQVGTQRLMEIADTLRSQGRYDRAAEVYKWVLQREPNHLAARERLVMMQRGVEGGRRKVESGGQRFEVGSRRSDPQPSTLPPRPVAPRRQLTPPPAPPVIEDVPAFPGPPPRRKNVPPAPGALPSLNSQLSTLNSYQAASELPTTIVSGAGSEAVDTHTIQIIPASKRGAHSIQELKFREGEPGADEAPAGDGADIDIRPAGIEKPQVPAGLRELAPYVEQPGRHVAEITGRLYGPSPAVRSLAAFLLGRAGQRARSSVPVLEGMLSSEPNGPSRIRVAEALLRISPQHMAALQTLLAGLSASDRAVRWESVVVSNVVNATTHRMAVLAKVIDRLRDVEPRIRVMAVLKLGEARADKEVATAALHKVLHAADSTEEIRKAATISLAALHWVPRRRAAEGGESKAEGGRRKAEVTTTHHEQKPSNADVRPPASDPRPSKAVPAVAVRPKKR